jgi:hypothetical protein
MNIRLVKIALFVLFVSFLPSCAGLGYVGYSILDRVSVTATNFPLLTSGYSFTILHNAPQNWEFALFIDGFPVHEDDGTPLPRITGGEHYIVYQKNLRRANQGAAPVSIMIKIYTKRGAFVGASTAKIYVAGGYKQSNTWFVTENSLGRHTEFWSY